VNLDQFKLELTNLKIPVTSENLQKLNEYYLLLKEWNNKINLTTIIAEEEVYLKHFYDSLTLFKSYDLNNNINLCDIGSGAGFPGIVLKIFFPNLNITLVDSQKKRISFLNLVIENLKLDNIEAIHSRSEELVKNKREYYDLVTARAVSRLNILSELCLPLVKQKGYFIAMKGNSDDEVKEALSAIKSLGGQLEEVKKFKLPIEESTRSLIKIMKKESTDKRYPRKFEKIKQKPL
jgi:16S rRNA (guanine527-N7)-methyltransferase